MNKEIENIKAEISTLDSDIKAYQEMVSNKLKSLYARLNEIGKEKPVTEDDWLWVPDRKCKHYMVREDGIVIECFGTSWFLSDHIKSYNVFKTKELAESRKHLSRLQRKWAFILDYLGRDESKIMTGNNYKYYPMYRINNREVMVTSDSNVIHGHPSQYAESIEMCKKAIEIMGDDIYPYLGVEKCERK
jgi:hypothetical protein